MKRVLITGASGFVGRHCVPLLLARDYEVHAITTRRVPEPAPGVRWHVLDMLDAMATGRVIESTQPTHLLHLAWCTGHGAFWTSPDNVRWVSASLDLVRQFCAAGGKRVVGAGTCAEYDWRYGFCSEQHTPLAPATLYGTCKHAFHAVVEQYARVAGFTHAWGRLFLLYGPFEHRNRLVASVVRSLTAGEPALCTHGRQIRDLLHTADAADGLVTLLDHDVEGAFNIASGMPTRLSEVIKHIAHRLQRPELIRLNALPARDEPPVLVADVARSRELLGWRPRYSLEQGLDDVITWWSQNADTREP